ncbi:MAG: hypothetical protein J7K40_12030 [candidate division Zixibacteria bacterium]|nr:hypothetical protein [candidate division Zixibacteria bacterium]
MIFFVEKFYILTGTPGRFTYNGNEYNDTYDFDLHYYGARFMDPSLGRFITVDPVKDFLNPYSYVGSNPSSPLPLEAGVGCLIIYALASGCRIRLRRTILTHPQKASQSC